MRRFTIARAGRPEKTFVSAVCSCGPALQRGANTPTQRGFRAEQIGCADLNGRGTQRHRCGHVGCIGYAPAQ